MVPYAPSWVKLGALAVLLGAATLLASAAPPAYSAGHGPFVVTSVSSPSCPHNNTPGGCLASHPATWDPIRSSLGGFSQLKLVSLRWRDWGKARAYATGRAVGCTGPAPCQKWQAPVSFYVYHVGFGDCCGAILYYCLRFTRASPELVYRPIGIDALPDDRSKCG